VFTEARAGKADKPTRKRATVLALVSNPIH